MSSLQRNISHPSAWQKSCYINYSRFLLHVLIGDKFSPYSGEMARCRISTSCQTITADTSGGNRKNGWVTACPAQRRGSIERNHHHCAEIERYFPVWFSTSFQSLWDRKKIYSSYERNIWLIRHQHLFPFISELLFCVVLVDTMTFSHYDITVLGLPLC